jgi:hypothetical protein
VSPLYHAHSGLRYLVLLAAGAALIALAHALASGRTTRAARVLPTAFTGLLDLQLLLGIGLVIGGIFTDAVAGHMVLMTIAVAVAHGAAIVARRAADDRRELSVRLGGIVLAVALIAGGILTLGRSILGSAPPTIG